MNRQDYYRAVLLGVIVGMAFLSMFYVFISPVEDVKPAEALEPVTEPVEKHGTFTVISEYKGCDLVQWQYGMLAEYKYFLHCDK